MFHLGTLQSFLAAVQFYESRLEQDIKLVREDPELSSLLDQEALDSYPVGRDLHRTKRVREWLERSIAKGDQKRSWSWDTKKRGTC